jgi:hypothetical protein
MQVTENVFRDICGADFWIKQMANDMSSSPKPENAVFIVDDLRFWNEALWLKSVGASIVRVITPPIGSEIPCPSEMCTNTFPVDFVFTDPVVSFFTLTSGLMPFVLSAIRSKK